MSILHQLNGQTGDDTLANALTSGNSVTRIMARGAAAEWSASMVDWLNDELKRSSNPTDLLPALAMLQIQTFASLASQLVSAGGYSHVVQLYVELTQSNMNEHMQRTAQAVAQRELRS